MDVYDFLRHHNSDIPPPAVRYVSLENRNNNVVTVIVCAMLFLGEDATGGPVVVVSRAKLAAETVFIWCYCDC